VEGLRVADASIMPTVINCQCNAACVMIGERAADFILESGDGRG
jgi:choline dehydrogenase